jgi:5-methylcytosine-specific restriction endonuclease McrA
MEAQPLPKPTKRPPKSKREPNPQKQQRVVDPDAVNAARRPYCQYCGLSKTSVQYQVHHIDHRSQSGGDVPENLISLCNGPGSNDCHDRAHHKKLPAIDKKDLREMREMDHWRWEG